MKKSYFGIANWMLVCYLSVFVLGVIFGSFFDYQIDAGLYQDHNVLSKFFEYVGTLPVSVIIGASGLLYFFYFRKKGEKEHKYVRIAYLLLVVCLLIAGCFWGYDTFHRHILLNHGKALRLLVSVLIGIPVIAALEVPVYFFLKDGESDDYLHKGNIIVISSCIVVLLTFGLKYLIDRPRFMWLVTTDNPKAYYRDWFTFAHGRPQDMHDLKGALIDTSRVESYMFQSWPSGHSSFTALMLLIALFPSCNKKTEGKELGFFLFAFLWCLVCMLSRMMDGHHFLTDVSWGMFFGVLPPYLTSLITYKKNNKTLEKVS